MILIVLLTAVCVCALLALRSPKPLPAAVWLAATSALTAVSLFSLSGHEVAVLELSVGAGLVTILLVYAISVSGGSGDDQPVINRWLAAGLVGAPLVLLLALILPLHPATSPTAESSFGTIFWDERRLDLLVQVAIVFTSGLTLIGFLAAHTQTEARPVTHVAPDVRLTSPALPKSPSMPVERPVIEKAKV